MSIDRLSGKGPQPTDPRKTGAAAKSQPASDAAAPKRHAGSVSPSDEVRISSDVSASESGEIPRGEVSGDRLREIGDRIASGFYDRPEVVDVVARGILADLTDAGASA